MKLTATLIIGHNIAGQPMLSTSEICDHATDYLEVSAFTAYECFGMWNGEREDSTKIEICALEENEAEAIRERVALLAQVLHQDAILFELRPDQIEFIERERVAAIKNA